ncbi:MAG: hypothetical protein QY326_07555 [Bdellovibrionota bacterium]|nr:MAG: hypothetical protein QY326_07555 [Bdellovibrionota bacterium]
MKSLRFHRIGVASVFAALLAVVDASSAFAIGGCSRRPNPTNPDDDGYVNCLAAEYRGCRSQCRALNRCFNANNPPSLVGCRDLLREFNDCVANNGALGSSMNSISWGPQGCEMSGDGVMFSSGSKVQQQFSEFEAVPVEDCDWVVTSIISGYFGIPGSQIQSTTDIRDDLGASEREVQDITTLVGDHFGVLVESEVTDNMRTVSDIVGCIQQAAQ